MPSPNENLTISKSDSWRMFDEISPRYDLLNHLLSFGLDVFWRRQLVRFLPAQHNQKLLDLATGTADVPLTLVRHNENIEYAVGIDLADKMLAVGQAKVTRARLEDKIFLSHGDANHIAFNADVFNVVTMAFGIRNVEGPLRSCGRCAGCSSLKAGRLSWNFRCRKTKFYAPRTCFICVPLCR